MTSQQSLPFSRKFAAADMALFHALIDGIAGNKIARVDRLYGGALSVHVGALVPGRRRDRGAWVVTVWGGDLRVTGPKEVVVRDRMSSDADEQQTVQTLNGLVGQTIDRVDLAAADLTLSMTLSHGTGIHIFVDPKYAGDASTISLPSHQTPAVSEHHQWRLDPDEPSAAPVS